MPEVQNRQVARPARQSGPGQRRSGLGRAIPALALALLALLPLPAAATTLGEVLDSCVSAVRDNDLNGVAPVRLHAFQGDMLGFADLVDGRVAVEIATDTTGRLWKCSVAGYDPQTPASARTPGLSREQAEPALIVWFLRAGRQRDTARMQMAVAGERGLVTCPAGDGGGWMVHALRQVSFGVVDVPSDALPVYVTVSRALPGNMTDCERMGR